MSEYSRWRERRSTVATAKPPTEPRARQRLYAAHTKCAAHAEPHIDSWHTYAKYSARAEPSRQDRRHAANRQDWSLGGTHADSTPAHAKQACAAATPSQPSTPGRTTPRRAEPPRQAARRRLHAAHAKPAKGTPSTAADNVTRVTSDTSVYVQPAQSKYDARS